MAWCALCFQSCHCSHLVTNPNRAKAQVFPTIGWLIIKRCPEIIFSGRLIMELTIAHNRPKGSYLLPRRHPGGPHEAQEVREVKYHKSGSPLSPNTILNKTPQSYKAFLRVTSIMTAYFCGNLAPVLWPQEYHTSSLLIKTARIPSAKAVWGIKTQFPFCLLMMC